MTDTTTSTVPLQIDLNQFLFRSEGGKQDIDQILANNAELKDGIPRETYQKLTTNLGEPYHSNQDFIDTVLAYFMVLRALFRVEELVQDAALGQSSTESAKPKLDLQTLRANLEDLKRLQLYCESVLDNRLLAHKDITTSIEAYRRLPRMIRLAARVELSDVKELMAMIYYVLAVPELYNFAWAGSGYLSVNARCMKYAAMTQTEFMRFFQSDRLIVKDKIIIADDEDPISRSNSVPFATSCVLSGTEIPLIDMLKIDKTILSELVMEESDEPRQNLGESLEIPVPGAEDNEENDGEGFSNDDEDKVRDDDQDDNIYDFLRKQVQENDSLLENSAETSTTTAAAGGADGELKPYTDNIDYFNDHIQWLSSKIRVQYLAKEIETSTWTDNKQQQKLREVKAQERMAKAKCNKRSQLTRETSKWLPRVELLVSKLKLDDFEKNILLVLAANSLSTAVNPSSDNYASSVESWSVMRLLKLFCTSFEEEVRCRKYFYKSSKLIKEGIMHLSDTWGDELMNVRVDIDRRMLDFVVELDAEINEMVEGSHLYTPTVKLDNVILPEEQKRLIVETVGNFENFSKARKRLGFEETISYGTGMLLLFYGKSGTGKTMLANAIGNHLGKRILLINYPSLGMNSQDQVIKYIFREAKLTDSILFFDECESIFMSRDFMSGSVNMILTELERHNGLIIMATNRSYDLDEAMHRRITMAIEFRTPDPELRQQIWKAHFPASATSQGNLSLDEGIDWKHIALKYELTGGFIKNAILSALSAAVSRNPNQISITQADLERGAQYQLRGRLAMVDFDRRVVPKRGMDDIIVSAEIRKQLMDIVSFEKARAVLFSAWGYDDKTDDQSIACLFGGPPGVGKSLAAEAIGLETGKPLMVVNVAQLVSEYVGRTGKNIETVFKEASNQDAVLVFDECEALFGQRSSSSSSSAERGANMDVGLLLYHIERFHGITILISNMPASLDAAFMRRLKFVVDFPLPTAPLRQKLWQASLPPLAPKSKDIDFARLANTYAFSGGHIKNCCFKGAARAALRFGEERMITMKDLEAAAEEENNALNGKGLERAAAMFS